MGNGRVTSLTSTGMRYKIDRGSDTCVRAVSSHDLCRVFDELSFAFRFRPYSTPFEFRTVSRAAFRRGLCNILNEPVRSAVVSAVGVACRPVMRFLTPDRTALLVARGPRALYPHCALRPVRVLYTGYTRRQVKRRCGRCARRSARTPQRSRNSAHVLRRTWVDSWHSGGRDPVYSYSVQLASCNDYM